MFIREIKTVNNVKSIMIMPILRELIKPEELAMLESLNYGEKKDKKTSKKKVRR